MENQPENINPNKDRRRWWVALLLLFPTGAGYIYVGRPGRFVSYMMFGFSCAIVVYHGIWGWLGHPLVFLAFLAAVVIATIGFVRPQHNLWIPNVGNIWYL